MTGIAFRGSYRQLITELEAAEAEFERINAQFDAVYSDPKNQCYDDFCCCGGDRAVAELGLDVALQQAGDKVQDLTDKLSYLG